VVADMHRKLRWVFDPVSACVGEICRCSGTRPGGLEQLYNMAEL